MIYRACAAFMVGAAGVCAFAGGVSGKPGASGEAAGPGVRELLHPVRAAGAPRWDAPVVRSRAVAADLGLLTDQDGGGGGVVRLSLFEDAVFDARLDPARRADALADARAGAWGGGVGVGVTWTGELLRAADGAVCGSFVAGVVGDAVMLAAWIDDGRVFEVRTGPDGLLWARELEQGGFEPCATTMAQAVAAGPGAPGVPGGPGGGAGADTPRGGCADDGSVIDVMIVYTPAARDESGGVNAVLALAASCIASANNAYEASAVDTRARLVYAGEVDYEESGSFGSDLSRLRGTADGFIDGVHALRDQFEADMVAMLSDSTGACGIGYLMTNLSESFQSSAFTVTRYSCAVGNLSFAHELGHNMGCTHDRDNAGSGLFEYSYGHRWYSDNGNRYRSVMSYSPGSRVPRFSNPDVLYLGTPTGVAPGEPNSAHNALTINQSAPTIAGFRQSGDGAGPTIVQGPQAAAVPGGQTLDLSVTADGPGLSFAWFRDGAALEDDGRVTGSTTAALTVGAVTSADAGGYVAVVTNACGVVASDPAQVSVLPGCPADLAEPFGVLDFFDASAFLTAFGSLDPAADFAEPSGVWNFFDVSAFLGAYNAGCP